MVSRFISNFIKRKPSDQTLLGEFIGKVKEELNEHLDTLNANTQELQLTYEYVCQLEEKIEKLNEKIDSIQLALGLGNQFENRISKNTVFPLREQEVFLLLYTSEEPLTIKDIARKLGISDYQAQRHITGLISRKVPVLKKHICNESCNEINAVNEENAEYVLHPEFKQLQAKNNVIGISEVIAKQF